MAGIFPGSDSPAALSPLRGGHYEKASLSSRLYGGHLHPHSRFVGGTDSIHHDSAGFSGAGSYRALFGISFGAHSVTFFQQIALPYSEIIPAVIGQDCALIVVYYLVWKYIVGSLNRML